LDYHSIVAAVKRALGTTGTTLGSLTVTGDASVGGNLSVTGNATFAWSTGDVKLTLKIVADAGWVFMNDGTIGNAASGATTRANADTLALFTHLWNVTANADCAVLPAGRGATAAADYTANKTIALPKALGRALAAYGAGAGLTARALAQTVGAEDAVVVAHTHLATSVVTDPTHSHPGGFALGGGGATSGSGTQQAATSAAATGITVATTNASTGVSGTGANVPPTTYLNVMVKL
jgi:hypothetical protein